MKITVLHLDILAVFLFLGPVWASRKSARLSTKVNNVEPPPPPPPPPPSPSPPPPPLVKNTPSLKSYNIRIQKGNRGKLFTSPAEYNDNTLQKYHANFPSTSDIKKIKKDEAALKMPTLILEPGSYVKLSPLLAWASGNISLLKKKKPIEMIKSLVKLITTHSDLLSTAHADFFKNLIPTDEEIQKIQKQAHVIENAQEYTNLADLWVYYFAKEKKTKHMLWTFYYEASLPGRIEELYSKFQELKMALTDEALNDFVSGALKAAYSYIYRIKVQQGLEPEAGITIQEVLNLKRIKSGDKKHNLFAAIVEAAESDKVYHADKDHLKTLIQGSSANKLSLAALHQELKSIRQDWEAFSQIYSQVEKLDKLVAATIDKNFTKIKADYEELDVVAEQVDIIMKQWEENIGQQESGKAMESSTFLTVAQNLANEWSSARNELFKEPKKPSLSSRNQNSSASLKKRLVKDSKVHENELKNTIDTMLEGFM